MFREELRPGGVLGDMTARLRILLVAVLATAGLGAALATTSSGRTRRPPTLTLRSVHVSSLNAYVVANPAGHTLYHRTGETTRHLLCTSASQCTSIWPPLTVTSNTRLVKGPGVHGTLSMFRRPDRRFQVTLNGQPLYRFSMDRRSATASGDGVPGEGTGGGTWRAVRASAPRRTTSTTPPPSSTQPPPSYTPPPSSMSPSTGYPIY
jgi:predicted lipoprotein with Yx(FWY)xxD motif